jgi:hypothetical protein
VLRPARSVAEPLQTSDPSKLNPINCWAEV